MRGRGRGRGSAGQTPLPGMSDMGETGEVVEDKSPPPDYPELWNEKHPFKTIDPCVGNEPYKARMAIKIQMSSRKSPFYLEPEDPAPEIETWMTRNKIYSKPTKKKPSEVIEFQENLFPFELLPRKMQNEIKKNKRKRERADDDQFKDLLRKEKESGAYTEDAEEKVDEDRGSQSENDEDNENRQEDEEREMNDDDDPEQIDGVWLHNDDDSLGEEDDSEGEAMF